MAFPLAWVLGLIEIHHIISPTNQPDGKRDGAMSATHADSKIYENLVSDRTAPFQTQHPSHYTAWMIGDCNQLRNNKESIKMKQIIVNAHECVLCTTPPTNPWERLKNTAAQKGKKGGQETTAGLRRHLTKPQRGIRDGTHSPPTPANTPKKD